MLSRSILRVSRIIPCQRTSPVRCQRRSVRWFSQLPQRREQHASSCQVHAEKVNGQSGEQQQPQRGSIRPFTVLLLCIPLGYGVNWALKQNEAQTSPDGFVKYMLASKNEVSSTCSIFSLIPKSPNTAIDLKAPNLARSITSVQFKQPQLQIARSYTLLPTVEGQDDDELRFLIKREQRGEVSGYLHRLPLEAEVEVRGVSREYVVPEGVEKVVFLAGGTGIAPVMQVANMLKRENVDMRILWANRKREDCMGGTSDHPSASSTGSWWSLSRLWSSGASGTDVSKTESSPASQKHPIVQDLDAIKTLTGNAGHKLSVHHFVDEESTFIKTKDVSHLLQEPAQGKKLLIVSGPEGFVNYWAGPKQWLNGREVQGPVAGMLGTLNTTGWEIVKL